MDTFNSISSKQWKQKIQFDLNGADYNASLVHETLEGIKIKPFYHSDDISNIPSVTFSESTVCQQSFYLKNTEKTIKHIRNALEKGVKSIKITIPNVTTDIIPLLNTFENTSGTFVLEPLFLDAVYIENATKAVAGKNTGIHWLSDPIHHLASDGNWFMKNMNAEFTELENINSKIGSYSFLMVKTGLYQQAGAHITQQLAYGLAHLNEYLVRLPNWQGTIVLEVSVGSRFFFEIAKIRAFRWLFDTLKTKYKRSVELQIIAKPSLRNKNVYGYSSNAEKSSLEYLSAFLGGADIIEIVPPDVLFRKSNENSNQKAREEFQKIQNSLNPYSRNLTSGSYYIDSITGSLAEQALILFKEIEKNGGLITQLITGNIQKKIAETAQKEQDLFDKSIKIYNPHPGENPNIELYPFVKQNPRKTLISPIIERRLAEKAEKEIYNDQKKPDHAKE